MSIRGARAILNPGAAPRRCGASRRWNPRGDPRLGAFFLSERTHDQEWSESVVAVGGDLRPHASGRLHATMRSDHLIVVLVHGTKVRLFGRELLAPPTWTKPDSLFRSSLAGILGEKPLFVEFEWSGANTHRARISAAGRLADLLRQLRREHAAAMIVLIAHSHGGNVALYAMRQLGTAGAVPRHPVDGLVCLGTPFLRARLRDLTSVFRRFWASLPWAVSFALVALIPLLGYLSEQVGLTPPWAAIVVGVLATVIIWQLGGEWLLKRYFTAQKEDALMLKAQRLATAVDCHLAFNTPPILVVKSDRDEAKLWLTLLDRSVSVLSGERLLQWTTKAVLAGTWLASRGVAWAISAAAAILLHVLGAAEDSAKTVRIFVYAPMLALIVLSLSHSMLFVAIVLVLRGSTLAFGQSLFLSLVASVSARDHVSDENHPEVRVITLTLPPRVFHHTSFYIDRQTIEAIGTWVTVVRRTA